MNRGLKDGGRCVLARPDAGRTQRDRKRRYAQRVCNRNRYRKRESGATHLSYAAPPSWNKTARRRLLVVLGLDHFATTVETVRADVVTQVGLARGRLDGQVRGNQEIVRTVHAALRRGLLILLNCHDDS